MEAVVRDFGDRNPQEDPVIHFYELFLKEYDAKKRMKRGVFYTPRPVVSYIVRSVHELLRTEFGLEGRPRRHDNLGRDGRAHEGLRIPEGVARSSVRADSRPRHWHRHVPRRGHRPDSPDDGRAKWTAKGTARESVVDLWNEYVPKHLLPRLHGYELLMAPYAIAHLKIGLKLYETGYRFEQR